MTPNVELLLLSYQKVRYACFISDFRELNKWLQRNPFPILKINNLLRPLEGFQYAASLDLNMGYYHIELNLHAQEMCTIVLPWGKYCYKQLPMGVAIPPTSFKKKSLI